MPDPEPLEMDPKHVRARGSICGRVMSARMLMAILGSCGMGIAYGLKVNLSVAIVSMINHTYLESLPRKNSTNVGCNLPELPGGEHEDGPFNWPSTLQGTILGSYFWGYMVSVFPGARIGEIFSAKWVMFFAIALNVICTLFTPLTAKMNVWAFVAMRVGLGLGGGVTFPSMHTMISNWIPPNERSYISGIVYAGTSLGTVLFMLFSGLIANRAGWEAVFYLEGGISAIWCILWAILIRDTPAKQPFISEEERTLIMESLNVTGPKKKKAKSLPWKAICKSVPFWALCVSHFCNNWNFYLVLLNLPLYFRNILKMNLKENAVASSIPYFTMWVFCVVLGKTLDQLRTKKILSTVSARRIAMAFASVIPMMCFVVLCFFGCNRLLAVILLGIIITTLGGMFCSVLCNHIDLAPNYAGSLVGLTNTPGSIGGIVVPIIVGKITENDPTIKAWQTIFWITIGIYLLLIIVYSTLTSGEEQPWNKIEDDEEEEEGENKETAKNTKKK